MKKALFVLVVGAGVGWGVAAPTQAQQRSTCPPGQVGSAPYCETPPPACAKFTSKLSILATTINRAARRLTIFAPITRLASGNATILFHAAGTKTTFSAPVDSANGYIRVSRSVNRAQALLGTGIVTISYPGDADTRSQVVRLRAARNPAKLKVTRPTITPSGVLLSDGIVTSRARGKVRVQLEYVDGTTGATVTIERKATIDRGMWSLSEQLSPATLAGIGRRCGTVHSYTLFTGYLLRRIRGEMRSYQVLPNP